MAPEVAYGNVDERVRRLGEKHLAAVAGGGDASPFVHVQADVALVRHARLARVESHPHPDRARSERPLRFLRRCDRVRGAGEGDKERVALRVHLDAAVIVERGSEQAAVLVERRCVAVAELVQQLRRALDVGEEERDDASRQIAGHRQR